MTTQQDKLRTIVDQTRTILLELHKMIIDQSRKDYEAMNGAVSNPWNFLQLLMTDPAFAWIHPISTTITSIDELLESTLPMRELDATAVRAVIENLLGDFPTTPQHFHTHYLAMMQRQPDIVMAHSKLKQKIQDLPKVDLNKMNDLLKVQSQWTGIKKMTHPRGSGTS